MTGTLLEDLFKFMDISFNYSHSNKYFGQNL